MRRTRGATCPTPTSSGRRFKPGWTPRNPSHRQRSGSSQTLTWPVRPSRRTRTDMREFHPLADAFPLIEDDSPEFAELVKDIETHGQLLPIVMYEGKILDGRNRARAIDKINEGRAVSDRTPHTRSEERRVGKECRSRWS